MLRLTLIAQATPSFPLAAPLQGFDLCAADCFFGSVEQQGVGLCSGSSFFALGLHYLEHVFSSAPPAPACSHLRSVVMAVLLPWLGV